LYRHLQNAFGRPDRLRNDTAVEEKKEVTNAILDVSAILQYYQKWFS
jgi:hypothetical protein